MNVLVRLELTPLHAISRRGFPDAEPVHPRRLRLDPFALHVIDFHFVLADQSTPLENTQVYEDHLRYYDVHNHVLHDAHGAHVHLSHVQHSLVFRDPLVFQVIHQSVASIRELFLRYLHLLLLRYVPEVARVHFAMRYDALFVDALLVDVHSGAVDVQDVQTFPAVHQSAVLVHELSLHFLHSQRLQSVL